MLIFYASIQLSAQKNLLVPDKGLTIWIPGMPMNQMYNYKHCSEIEPIKYEIA